MAALGDVVLYGVTQRDVDRFNTQRTHRCKATGEVARFVAGDVLPAVVVQSQVPAPTSRCATTARRPSSSRAPHRAPPPRRAPTGRVAENGPQLQPQAEGHERQKWRRLSSRLIGYVALGGAREVTVEGTWEEASCPGCGVLSGRVHQRTRQRLRDVPVAGSVEVVVLKRRFACEEEACPRRTFVEVSDQVPARARVTTRLRTAVLDAVVGAGRVVAEVAAAHRVAWWTVQRAVSAAADLLIDPDEVPVKHLGIDEHRYRSVRFYREPSGVWRRYEPWMTTFVDATTGQVLGVVDGRDSAGVGAWLAARSEPWREGVQVFAIDPSAAFRRALREHLPRAAVSVDAFHLVKLGNDMVTRVRQRVSHRAKGPPRARDRPGVDQPAPAAARRGHPVPAGPEPAAGHCSPRTSPPTRSAPLEASRSTCASSSPPAT